MGSSIINKGSKRGVEVAAVRIAMIEEGLSLSALATRAGIPAQTLSTELTIGVRSLPVRLKIEAAFNYTRPIWSDTRTLAQRKRCVEVFGFDPCVLRVRELRDSAAKTGADFSQCNHKEDFIKEIFARAAVCNPNRQ